MFLRFESSPARLVIGIRQTMSVATDTTPALFGAFMPRRNEIPHRKNQDVLCLQNYPPAFFSAFNPLILFEKWAGVEVPDFSLVPSGMQTLIVPAGEYAVFLFKGRNSDAAPFFQNIYMNWFPASDYIVDDRPHFDVLGSKYKYDSSDSEEEIWIPVKRK